MQVFLHENTGTTYTFAMTTAGIDFADILYFSTKNLNKQWQLSTLSQHVILAQNVPLKCV